MIQVALVQNASSGGRHLPLAAAVASWKANQELVAASPCAGDNRTGILTSMSRHFESI